MSRCYCFQTQNFIATNTKSFGSYATLRFLYAIFQVLKGEMAKEVWYAMRLTDCSCSCYL